MLAALDNSGAPDGGGSLDRGHTAAGSGMGDPTLGTVALGPGDTCHLDVGDRFGNLVSAPPSGGWLQSSPVIPRVGICYNRLTTTLAEVREQAQRECPANTVANQTDSDWYMEHCPLLLPERGTFSCTARK